MVAYTYYESDPRVIREAEAAVAGGFDVDFLALRRPGTAAEENVRGVHVIRLNQAKYRGRGHLSYLWQYVSFFLRCLAASTRLQFRRRYRVVHVNNMPDFLVFSCVTPRLVGAKLILDIHDPMPNTFASKFQGKDGGFFYWALLWQERLSAAFCHQVITVHEPVKQGILVKHGLAPESIGVVANFADESVFRLRESLPNPGHVRAVFHGTILERSGLRTFVEALAQVRHRDRISAKIVGEGDFSAPLRELIAELRLEDIVTFDNHTYPAHAIAAQIEDCNVGVVPLVISSVTRWALPLKLVEYISMGLPVVSVRSDAIQYYLSEEECLFFDWDRPEMLAAALDRLAEQPELMQQYRQRSIAARGRFSWAAERDKYIALLRQLSGEGTREEAGKV